MQLKKDGEIYTRQEALLKISADTGIQCQNADLSVYGYERYVPEPPPPLPVTVITALQGEMAIEAAGKSAEYQAFVESLPFLARSNWMRQTHWRIDDPLIIAGASEIGVGDMLHDLFTQAAGL